MSNLTAKPKKPTLKVTACSRTTNASTSGILRVNYSRSANASQSRKSFSVAGDSKILEKTSGQTIKLGVQVFDENGTDVTPQRLYQSDPAVVQPKMRNIFTSQDISGGSVSGLFSTTFHSTNASFAGPFTRSVFGSSTLSRPSQSTVESLNDEIVDPFYKRDISINISDVQVRRDKMKEPIRDDILDDIVEKYLTETETIWLLDMPAIFVSVDSEEAEAVKERSNVYRELCKNRMGNYKYVERFMQTFNGARKTKEVQTEGVALTDGAITATVWDMYDTFLSNTETEDTTKPTETEKSSSPDKILSHRLKTSRSQGRTMSLISTPSTASASSSHAEVEAIITPIKDEPVPELTLQSEKFQQDLCVMERIVLGNIFQSKMAAYRQLPILEDAGETEKYDRSATPAMECLWSFMCELTAGRNVSCMAWNRKNPDLLAVGYGQFDYKDQKSGLICCWSLKNPMWPERIFHCQSGVTALDFSASNPSQLAVGMHDGSLAICNVQRKEKTPVTDSSKCPQKHSSPVWQVTWIEQERGQTGEEKGEALVSVSADGRICRWFLRKGLDCVDLIKLKRPRNEKTKTQAGEKQEREVLILQQAPGLCIDFHPKDSNIYLAGTEEGNIHKCSCLYSEQYLETYTAHKGPIYRVTWSPFYAEAFLSCSSDRTIQLWRQDLPVPVLVFASSQRAVFDVAWSPRWPTVFAAVNEGRVEIWDVSSNILDPTILSAARPGVKFTSLLFATETDCILLGHSDGLVGVYQLKNLTAGKGAQVDTLEEIIRSNLVDPL